MISNRMNLRRIVSPLLGLAFLATVAPAAAQAPYPSRPIQLIVGLPPGGTGDIVARVVSQKLSARLGQPVIVENKPGAGGVLGMGLAAKAAPDGYTLAYVTNAFATMADMYRTLSFSPATDFVPIGLIGTTPYVFLTPPDAPYKTVAEFVSYAKAHPGDVKYASAGLGTLIHLIPASLAAQAKLELLHVPYNGSAPALIGLLSKQVDIYFDPITTASEPVKSGRARALATTGSTRTKGLPNVPTLIEQGYPIQGATWLGIMAPKGTPQAIVDRLSKELNAVLQEPDIQEQMKKFEVEIAAGSPQQFGDFVKGQTEFWGKVVRDAGIKLDN